MDDTASTRDCPILLVRLQFFGSNTDLRSYCRRSFKLGHVLSIFLPTDDSRQDERSRWQSTHRFTNWTQPRLVLDLGTIPDAQSTIIVDQQQLWNMNKCQEWQQRYFPNRNPKSSSTKEDDKLRSPSNGMQPWDNEGEQENTSELDVREGKHHGGGLGKRLQGECIANFLIHTIMSKLAAEHNEKDNLLGDPSQWATRDPRTVHPIFYYEEALAFLNSGSGVIDAAGGSGHVSMALGLAGISSTVVDARPSIGKLPGRDRKFWNQAYRKQVHEVSDSVENFCLPVVPFSTFRAWFGSRPKGIDVDFRHPDIPELPVCDESMELLANCSAIVALHPDEATGAIVDVAVRNRKPVVIVPCCVFCRLFPERRKPGTDQLVSTYQDLLEYLLDKDRSFKSAKLPIQGKSTVLWSTF